MTGKELYELQVDALLRLQNCCTDDWDELTTDDQEIWNDMAAAIEEKENAYR